MKRWPVKLGNVRLLALGLALTLLAAMWLIMRVFG